MDYLYFIGIIALVFSMLYGRMVFNKAMQTLSNDRRDDVYTVFSTGSKKSGIILIGILILFFILFKLNIVPTMTLSLIYFLILIGFLYFQMQNKAKMLKTKGFDESFIQYYKKSEYIKIAGILLFLGFLIYQFKK